MSLPELVLKVRIQNPNARENDFIEVELDRQELTYRSLLRVCCRELDISTEHVEKIDPQAAQHHATKGMEWQRHAHAGTKTHTCIRRVMFRVALVLKLAGYNTSG